MSRHPFGVLLFAAALVLAPIGARTADLVVWWDRGFFPDEDRAVEELVAAFESKTGKKVELAFHFVVEMPDRVLGALAARQPPDFLFGMRIDNYVDQWAHDGRLADLSDVVAPYAGLFDPDALARATLFDAKVGRRGLLALPMGRSTNHVHVWKSLLKQAGFTLADIPKEWEAFWSFWCDRVQPAVRRATGRDDIYGVGLPMAVQAGDTWIQFWQFRLAYGAEYVTADGQLVIDEPEVRAALVEALDRYASIYRQGCTPPDATGWMDPGNNKAFLDQRVVMTVNETLSIPNALKATRPEDYYGNAVTIDWPEGAHGRPLRIQGEIYRSVVFEHGGGDQVAKEFVRFLVADGWLAHWLDFARERMAPPMPALRDQPTWLDTSDPHQLRSVVQVKTRPIEVSPWPVSLESSWRYTRVFDELVWQKAVHRAAVEGVSPERAVDEAAARIKQILSE